MNPAHANPDPAQDERPAGQRRRRAWGLHWPCEVCGQWQGLGLCQDCLRRFAPATQAHCARCALPRGEGGVCGPCRRQPPIYDACITGVMYGFPWDRLIARLKFKAQPELATLLAERLHLAVSASSTQQALPRVQCVLPVPLSPSRLAERGYNQAWELARRVADRQGLKARADLLLRLRDTPHQVGLSRAQRQLNLRDALWVDHRPMSLSGLHVALVDDVLTTGGTADAATAALQAAGVASVQVWVLARTPIELDNSQH